MVRITLELLPLFPLLPFSSGPLFWLVGTMEMLPRFPMLPLRMVLSQLVPRVEPVLGSSLQLGLVLMCGCLKGPLQLVVLICQLLSQLSPFVDSMLELVFPLVPVLASTLQLSPMIMCRSLLSPMLMCRYLLSRHLPISGSGSCSTNQPHLLSRALRRLW